jgi:ABC-2 type transport system permease protein
MKKIFLIIQREYLTRVRKKSFLLLTLLLPLLYLGLIFGTGYIAKQGASTLNIAVVDNSTYFTAESLKGISTENTKFTLVHKNKDSLIKNYEKDGFNAYATIQPFNWENGDTIIINCNKAKGEITSAVISAKLNTIWNTIKQQKLGLDPVKTSALATSQINVKLQNINDPKADSKAASGIANVLAFLIYFIILLYGSQVMMSVMEEKTNRIAEVIISSVKPFQLMMGKIIGVGLVALTQFTLWIALILIAFNVFKGSSTSGASAQMIEGMQNTFAGVNLGYIIVFFFLYFIGGFFFYASIYAAIGSAVNEDIRDAQQLSFPVTLIIVFSFLITTMSANDPSSTLAFWGSMIPFSSPLVMMARIPYGVPSTVPWWQLIMSLVILYSSIIAIAWVSAKIYRTGILMYGKKVSLKEMLKWITRK